MISACDRALKKRLFMKHPVGIYGYHNELTIRQNIIQNYDAVMSVVWIYGYLGSVQGNDMRTPPSPSLAPQKWSDSFERCAMC